MSFHKNFNKLAGAFGDPIVALTGSLGKSEQDKLPDTPNLSFPSNQGFQSTDPNSTFADPRFDINDSRRSGFEEAARVGRFNRKDRPLGFLEVLLGRQEQLQGTINNFKNPFTQGLTQDLEAAATRSRSLRGRFDNLGDSLRQGSLARTQGAQVAALNAARIGSGRGGTAFGGGSRAIATRAAREAATQQSAGLAQALIQGTQLKGDFDLRQNAQEAGIAQSLANVRGQQAGLAEAQIGRQVSSQQSFQEILASLAGATGRPTTVKSSGSGLLGGLGGLFNT